MKSASSASHDESSTLAQAEALAALLEEERQILLRGDGAALQGLTARKQQALDALEACIQVNGQPRALNDGLRRQLAALQKANQQNGALLSVRQNYARWALERLRGDTAAPAYQPTGMNAGTAGARLIGRA